MSQPTITPRQRDILRHALGLNRSADAYRNHYFAGEGGADYPDCERLVALGLMEVRVRTHGYGSDNLYGVTDAGRELAHGEAVEGTKP